jgi:hypothetical protein
MNDNPAITARAVRQATTFVGEQEVNLFKSSSALDDPVLMIGDAMVAVEEVEPVAVDPNPVNFYRYPQIGHNLISERAAGRFLNPSLTGTWKKRSDNRIESSLSLG